jgi:hypothetical protein
MTLKRANSLIGKSRYDYKCKHVVNYVLYGDKNVGGLASAYLKYGEEISAPYQALDVVVGTDGAHCGIFISVSQFIHSSSKKNEVISVGVSQLLYVFPNGYEVRRN